MSSLHDSDSEEEMDELFQPQRNHAYTFPFLSPNIYGSEIGDTTSQTSLLSRSSTPAGSDQELDGLLPTPPIPYSGVFHEEFSFPNSTGPQISSRAQNYVSWGVSLRQPILMVSFCLLGLTSALCHHFYYFGLEGSTAGNTTKQQWVIWVGTGLNNFTLYCLNAANGISLTQCIWRTVKRRALTVGALDSLFGISNDITGFINFELLKYAKLTIFVAFIVWSMVLSAVIPPGTISVIPGTTPKPSFTPITVSNFNWTSAHGDNKGLLQFEHFDSGATVAYPGPHTSRIASQVAQDMFVSVPAGVRPNSSYTQQFLGPALQCNAASPSQQVAFDFYNEANYNQTRTVTVSQLQKGNLPHGYDFLQFFSAFSPQLYGYINDAIPKPNDTSDHYNNWQAMLPRNATNRGSIAEGAEIWIQLAGDSLVCSLTNASFEIGFQFINGTQNVIQHKITHLNKWTMSANNSSANYLGVMASLAPLLYGNVSMFPYSCDIGNGTSGECYVLGGTSSQVLQTGIGACEEFSSSWWERNIDKLNATHKSPAISFETQSSMCRNKTVARAIEDLAVNITIGMLGLDLSEFHPVKETVNATYYTLPNVYNYDSPKLLISYGAGVFSTLLCTVIGLIIFRINGISHDTSFSAIMTTTRNPDIDRLSVGQSMSAIEEDLQQTKLMFGANKVNPAERLCRGDEVERAAFGLEGKVVMLRKGGRYI